MGPSMPGSPCVEEQRVVDATPALGTGPLDGPGGGEGTYLSPLLSRLSRLAHVALERPESRMTEEGIREALGQRSSQEVVRLWSWGWVAR